VTAGLNGRLSSGLHALAAAPKNQQIQLRLLSIKRHECYQQMDSSVYSSVWKSLQCYDKRAQPMLPDASWQRIERLLIAAQLIKRLPLSVSSNQPQLALYLLYPVYSRALTTQVDGLERLDGLGRHESRRCVRWGRCFDRSGASNGGQPREALYSWPEWRLTGRLESWRSLRAQAARATCHAGPLWRTIRFIAVGRL
jgi:hypothetical protein